MCGIMGYIGGKRAKDVLLDGLSRLEYRGYDSAGVAIFQNSEIKIRRAVGKLAVLRAQLATEPLPGNLGIGHTRWATHGRPSENNAHPHQAGSIVLVHNGIIENYLELKEELIQQGCVFRSDTDTEVLAHLLQQFLKNTSTLRMALRKALAKVKGSYAVALFSSQDPKTLYVARLGSPLVIGLGDGEQFVASDIPAILPYTRKVIILEDGQMAELRSHEVMVTNLRGEVLKPKVTEVQWDLKQAEKCGFKHYMLKEIFDQPQSLSDTLTGRIVWKKRQLYLEEMEPFLAKGDWLKTCNRIYIIACGTSLHAGLVAKFYLEEFLKIPVLVDYASEFRYRQAPIDHKTLFIAVSQSGETADTLVALRNAKAKKAKALSICNVVGSTLARESHGVFYTRCGPEIGVAATKTFTAQILALLLLALRLGGRRGTLKREVMAELLRSILVLPKKVQQVLDQASSIQAISHTHAKARHYLYVGRGVSYPIALEAALKLKEIAYVHAEGYAAGELKHGPIALIDDGSPIVSLVSKDGLYEKMMSNVEEMRSRGGSIIAVATVGDKAIAGRANQVFYLPSTHPLLTPILEAVFVQLFAYYIADEKGYDIDQPRNLAKSVTVE